jgi:hypothetical protein
MYEMILKRLLFMVYELQLVDSHTASTFTIANYNLNPPSQIK